ncbi:EutN/CcmL family microcompartment protein [Alkalihalobacillus sp. BA299]|uniref:EutN/CcmL family microcompartment protein n=1 Tax=Alkalihalobacillus sp. BA299 TaxID=2815938 RepID=UPI001ADC7BA9|nr:EutN/CcmL family microcompartment protein [Alkalihalobacillus sp. BA299]
MELGTVIGNVWATRKEDELKGLKFLIVQPELPDRTSPGVPFVAVDRIGAGFGDQVLVTRGSAAANLSNEIKMPIDALIIGIIDSVDVEQKEVNGK